MAHLLGADALHLEFPTGVLFESVTLGLDEGARIGIVGRNGDGKSTLLSLLAGRMEPGSGRVTMQRGLEIDLLTQSDVLSSDLTVAQAIVGDLEEYMWAGNARIRDVINGLISNIPWDAKLDELSGGQRRRVALASLLVGDHEVIFLDEPTNHLDVEGITWLAEHLKRRWTQNAGALVVVTHDRWFLDEVCTTTWEVHDGVVDPFEGGYASYVLQRVERDRLMASTEAKRQNLMRKELAWLRRGTPARTTKAKFRVDAANQLIENEPPVRDKVSLLQMASSRLGKEVVDLLDVSVSFGDNEVLKNIEWRIAPGERAGILGINGAGKSTLLNLITGALQPTSGIVKRGKTIKIATLTQQSQELDDVANDRLLDVIARKRTTYVVGNKEMTSAQLLERLGFTNTQLSTPIKELSGGQKRRLQLLLILLDEPNVLILDEPSNDLDTDMLAAMEDLLDSWPGTLIVVSHDRYLMERITDLQYAIIDGRLRHLPGGVEQYVNFRKGLTQLPPSGGSTTANAKVQSSTKLTNTERHALQKEFGAVERKISKLPLQIIQVNELISAHDQSDYVGLAVHAETLIALKTKLSDLEHRWLELSEQLE